MIRALVNARVLQDDGLVEGRAVIIEAGRIAGVETAGDVGAGDDAEHGVVIAEPPDAESLTQVGVEVDAGHVASLGVSHRKAADRRNCR